MSKQAMNALWQIGYDTMAVHPLPWLWRFLFEYHIFVLPDQKERLRNLTYLALLAPDDTAISLLEILRSRRLTFVTVTTMMEQLKANKSVEFTEALVKSTTIDVMNDSQALEIAGKQGRLDIMRLILERGANINHICVSTFDLHGYDERGGKWQRKPEGTPLHGLAQSDRNIGAVKFLLESGASTYILDESGSPPVAVAIKHGAVKCTALVAARMIFGWALPSRKIKSKE